MAGGFDHSRVKPLDMPDCRVAPEAVAARINASASSRWSQRFSISRKFRPPEVVRRWSDGSGVGVARMAASICRSVRMGLQERSFCIFSPGSLSLNGGVHNAGEDYRPVLDRCLR